MVSSKPFRMFGPWALITGASSGIGEEYARQLASHGFNLVLAARRVDLLEQLGKELTNRFQIQYRTLFADLTKQDGHKILIEQCSDLDIGLFVANAGAAKPGRFTARGYVDLSEKIQLNALSHVWLAHYFSKKFVSNRRGGIVFTGAMGATGGVPFMAIESGTKAFIEGFGQALNYELRDKGVHVTVLVTPPTETPVLKEIGFSPDNMPATPISVSQCVKETIIALLENKPSVLPGRKFRAMNLLVPAKVSRALMGRIMKKNNNIE